MHCSKYLGTWNLPNDLVLQQSVLWQDVSYLQHWGENMVKYTKIVAKKNQITKEAIFTKTQESKFKFYLNFILKLLSPLLGLL